MLSDDQKEQKLRSGSKAARRRSEFFVPERKRYRELQSQSEPRIFVVDAAVDSLWSNLDPLLGLLRTALQL
jgi:hypothetical protein